MTLRVIEVEIVRDEEVRDVVEHVDCFGLIDLRLLIELVREGDAPVVPPARALVLLTYITPNLSVWIFP